MKVIDTDFEVNDFQYHPVVLVTIGGYDTILDPATLDVDLEAIKFKDYRPDEYIVVGAPSELEAFIEMIDKVEELDGK